MTLKLFYLYAQSLELWSVCFGAWSDLALPSHLLRTQSSWLFGDSVAWKVIWLMIVVDLLSTKSADLCVSVRCEETQYISELWTCVKVKQWMERWGKFTQNNAHGAGAVGFFASVELFVTYSFYFLVFIHSCWSFTSLFSSESENQTVRFRFWSPAVEPMPPPSLLS